MATTQQTKVLDRIERTLLRLALNFWYYNAMWRGEAISLASRGTDAQAAVNNRWRALMKSAACLFLVEETAFMQFATEQGLDGQALMSNAPAASEIWSATVAVTRLEAYTPDEAGMAFGVPVPSVQETVGRMRYWLKET